MTRTPEMVRMNFEIISLYLNAFVNETYTVWKNSRAASPLSDALISRHAQYGRARVSRAPSVFKGLARQVQRAAAKQHTPA
eukprot:12164486-Heterocapsa_arctica.AAC.1